MYRTVHLVTELGTPLPTLLLPSMAGARQVVTVLTCMFYVGLSLQETSREGYPTPEQSTVSSCRDSDVLSLDLSRGCSHHVGADCKSRHGARHASANKVT